MIKIEKRKELRGFIVEFLNGIYPNQISKESIYETFYEYWETEDIEKELAYLVDKNYVSTKVLISPFGSAFSKIHNFKLTATGKDLLDGTIDDPGVNVRR